MKKHSIDILLCGKAAENSYISSDSGTKQTWDTFEYLRPEEQAKIQMAFNGAKVCSAWTRHQGDQRQSDPEQNRQPLLQPCASARRFTFAKFEKTQISSLADPVILSCMIPSARMKIIFFSNPHQYTATSQMKKQKHIELKRMKINLRNDLQITKRYNLELP